MRRRLHTGLCHAFLVYTVLKLLIYAVLNEINR